MSAVSPSKYNRIELQKKGKDPVELKGGVVSVDYYESLYSPTVTANVMYMDAGGNLEDDKNKLTSDFDKAAEKSGASTGGGGSGGSETGEETTKTTVTTETTTEGADTTITPSDTTSENQSSDIDYKKKLDDALIKRAEYIESGDTSKLDGVNKKIEFYEKKLGIDSSSKFTILVKDSDGKVQKIDGSQLKAKTDNTVSMLNNGSSTNGSTTVIVQRQVVLTNVAVPV